MYTYSGFCSISVFVFVKPADKGEVHNADTVRKEAADFNPHHLSSFFHDPSVVSIFKIILSSVMGIFGGTG
jgi:hypothetical protein